MNKVKKSKKIFAVIFLTLLSFGLVEFVYANTTPSDCWTQEWCLGQAGSETEKYFFKIGDKAFQERCGGTQYGKCYIKPEEVELSVQIPDIQGGGTLQKVAQFPEYLKILYTYFIYVIGIIAVAYIGWGGFEWMMAAGSAEKIGKAKDTIQGAFIGLLLAVGSYVLLGTINSRLVNFDYMRVERIKPHFLMNYCVDTESVQKWIQVGDEDKVKVNKEDTWCNFTYYSEISSANTCQGLKCGDDKFCLPKFNASGSFESGFECTSIFEVAKSCNKQEIDNCELFDNYLEVVQKASPNSFISGRTCRATVYDHSLFVGLVTVGATLKDQCNLTALQTEDTKTNLNSFISPSINFFTYQRINCKQATYACLKNGEPRALKYISKFNNIPVVNLIVAPKVEVTCTDSKKAGVGSDSICLMSNQSVCSINKPDFLVTFEYIRLSPLQHDQPTFEWEEKPCSQFPPESGSCQSNETCWVMKVNYYEPKL